MMVERCWNGGEADGTVVERRLDFGGRMGRGGGIVLRDGGIVIRDGGGDGGGEEDLHLS